MLFDDYMQTCTRRVFTAGPDGLGGQAGTWADGGTFTGAIVKNSAAQRVIADRPGVYTSYTLTVKPGVVMAYHDVFKTADGREFRVISKTSAKAGDNKTPARASFQLVQVEAEEFTE